MKTNRVFIQSHYLYKLFFLTIILFAACKKNDLSKPNNNYVPDSSQFKIVGIETVKMDECNIDVYIDSSIFRKYPNVNLLWTTDSSFKTYDSIRIVLQSSGTPNFKVNINNLRDLTKYFFKIKLSSNNKMFFSDRKDYATNKLRIESSLSEVSKGDSIALRTNYIECETTDTSVGIYLNDIRCKDNVFFNCQMISAKIPVDIPLGRYKLKVKIHNMETELPDSVDVLRGYWNLINSPLIPNGIYTGLPAGLGNYAVCSDGNTKSYLIGGLLSDPVNDYWNQNINTDYSYQRAKFILEFDASTKTWIQKNMPSPRYFDQLTAQYYNNSIYVMSGIEVDSDNMIIAAVPKMLRLDLNTMKWITMDTIPYGAVAYQAAQYQGYSLTYGAIVYQASAQINNEFYVGFGLQTLGLSPEVPFNQLWKYSPQNNKWTRLADFPGTLNPSYNRYPTMVNLNNKLYAYIGSSQTYSYDRELWEYDPLGNIWQQITLPSGTILLPGERCSIGVRNNKLLFFTSQQALFGAGGNYFQINQSCVEFDPAENSWKKFSIPQIPDLLNLIGQTDSLIYLHSDQRGYSDGIWNNTFEFHYEN